MGPAPRIDSLTTAAIICAAGASARMGGIKKEYRPLPAGGIAGNAGGLTVLGAAVTAFARIPEIKTIVIVVPDDPKNGEAAARNALPPELFAGKDTLPILFVSGGATRQASVYNALGFLAGGKMPAPDFVLIHDGARPWVSPALIQRVIAAVKKHGAAIPLLPLTETPKETDALLNTNSDTVFIKQHLKREVVGVAQTPQAFTFSEILAAHAQAAKAAGQGNREYTDDAELWTAFNDAPVAAILGEVENRKITFPEDLC